MSVNTIIFKITFFSKYLIKQGAYFNKIKIDYNEIEIFTANSLALEKGERPIISIQFKDTKKEDIKLISWKVNKCSLSSINNLKKYLNERYIF